MTTRNDGMELSMTDSVADICGKAQEKAFERNFNGVYVAPKLPPQPAVKVVDPNGADKLNPFMLKIEYLSIPRY